MTWLRNWSAAVKINKRISYSLSHTTTSTPINTSILHLWTSQTKMNSESLLKLLSGSCQNSWRRKKGEKKIINCVFLFYILLCCVGCP